MLLVPLITAITRGPAQVPVNVFAWEGGFASEILQ